MAIDFEKVTYVDGETIIGAENLNDIQDAILNLDSNKVEKEQGKGLSTNDYTNEEKAKVAAAAPASALDDYRTAADQDTIDAAQDERIDAAAQATKSTTIGPAAIATFDASAADMPLKGLTVNIEPVQDLHGYDHPWPGGGGKNLLKYPYYNTTLTSNGITYTDNGDGSITVNGTATANADFYFFHSTASLPLPNGSYIFSSSYTGQIPDSGFYIHAKANEEDAAYLNVALGAEGSYTVSNGVFYSACIRVTNGKTINNVRVYPMIRLATETDDTFEPYSNICPISGWTGCNVTRTGKNLVNNTLYQSGNTNVIVGSNSFSNYPLFLKAGTYTVSFKRPTGKQFALFLEDEETHNQVTVLDSSSSATSATISLNKDDYYRFWFYKSSTSGGISIDDVADVMIKLGATASVYEPYQGNTYPITFPASAGTVYGGTLDVVNGVLTSTHRYLLLDDTLTYAVKSNSRVDINLSAANAARTEDDSILLKNAYCSFHQVGAGKITGKATGKSLTIVFHNISEWYSGEVSNAALRSYFKDMINAEKPCVLCYELENTTSYQLTAEQVTTLLSENNIWADCGDVTVTYGAYLETVKAHAERLGDSILSAIAPLEASYTASRAYAVGEFLFVGTKFYKVTAAIGSGDTINPGTNVTQTTVAAQLMELAGN